MTASSNLFQTLFQQTHTQTLPEFTDKQWMKRALEALLFASSEPLPFQKLRDILAEFHPITPSDLRQALLELALEYEKHHRAYTVIEVAKGFVLRTRPEFGKYIDLLLGERRSEKLSSAATEVLAIIAYKQPITRPQIEAIRGVDCSGVVQTLLERELIAPTGKLEVPGRPTLYGTTKHFLLHYGLRDLSDLPKVEV